MAGFYAELSRRGVLRVGIAYAAIAWLALQVIDVLGGILPLPTILSQILLVAIVTGFPVALVLAWFYDITPEGIVAGGGDRTSISFGGRTIDFVIIGALTLVIALLVLKDRITATLQERNQAPPVVSNYERITESQVIFPPYASPYPLVAANGRLYFNTFETGRMGIKQVAMSGGEAVAIPEPVTDAETIFRPTAALPDGSGMLLLAFSPGVWHVETWEYAFVGSSPRMLGLGAEASPSPDGTQVAYADIEMNIAIADSDFSNPRVVTNLRDLAVQSAGHFSWIRWSPDGQRLRFSIAADPRSIWEVDSAGGEARRVLPAWEGIDHCCGNWTPDGRYYVFQGQRGLRTQLYAIAEQDAENSEPVQITDGALDYRRPTVAPDGRSLFAIGWQLRGETVIVDPATGLLRPAAPNVELSGEWFHFARAADRMTWVSYPEGNLWVGRKDGGDRLQLTFDDFTAVWPAISPDGRNIAFTQRGSARDYRLYVVPATGGIPTQIAADVPIAINGNWSPDSRRFLYQAWGRDRVQVYDVLSAETSEVPGTEGYRNPLWSPSGRRLLASRNRQLLVHDLESGETQLLLEGRPLEGVYWGHDDDTVFVVDAHILGAERGIHRLDVASGEQTLVFKFGSHRLAMGQWLMWVGVSPAGEPMFLRDLSIHHIYRLTWLPAGELATAELQNQTWRR